MGRVLAILEQRDGGLKRVSHETLTAARALADQRKSGMDALVMGPAGVDVGVAGTFGAETVWVAGDERRWKAWLSSRMAPRTERSASGECGSLRSRVTQG